MLSVKTQDCELLTLDHDQVNDMNKSSVRDHIEGPYHWDQRAIFAPFRTWGINRHLIMNLSIRDHEILRISSFVDEETICQLKSDWKYTFGN